MSLGNGRSPMSQSSVSSATRLFLAARAEAEIPETTAFATLRAIGAAIAKHPDVIASASTPNASIALLTARKKQFPGGSIGGSCWTLRIE
jgi:hypothetical protein